MQQVGLRLNSDSLLVGKMALSALNGEVTGDKAAETVKVAGVCQSEEVHLGG